MNAPDDHPIEDIKTPKEDYTAKEVVKIQLKALRRNDYPIKNAGVKTLYNFASPKNRASTGPVSKFKKMVGSNEYEPMINHKGARLKEVENKNRRAKHIAKVVSTDEDEIKYVFRLSEQESGEWKNCWTTDSITRKREYNR